MNKWKGFEWTEECAQVFQQLKEYLSHPPIMSSPETDEVMFAFITVAPHAVSLVLIQVKVMFYGIYHRKCCSVTYFHFGTYILWKIILD